MLCGQVRYMKEMARENEEAEAEYARKQEELLAKHAPFSGPGHSLSAPPLHLRLQARAMCGDVRAHICSRAPALRCRRRGHIDAT